MSSVVSFLDALIKELTPLSRTDEPLPQLNDRRAAVSLILRVRGAQKVRPSDLCPERSAFFGFKLTLYFVLFIFFNAALHIAPPWTAVALGRLLPQASPLPG